MLSSNQSIVTNQTCPDFPSLNLVNKICTQVQHCIIFNKITTLFHSKLSESQINWGFHICLADELENKSTALTSSLLNYHITRYYMLHTYHNNNIETKLEVHVPFGISDEEMDMTCLNIIKALAHGARLGNSISTFT